MEDSSCLRVECKAGVPDCTLAVVNLHIPHSSSTSVSTSQLVQTGVSTGHVQRLIRVSFKHGARSVIVMFEVVV